jgi:hypothetical protein
MSETLTGTATDIPEYPMDRDAMCPFASRACGRPSKR